MGRETNPPMVNPKLRPCLTIIQGGLLLSRYGCQGGINLQQVAKDTPSSLAFQTLAATHAADTLTSCTNQIHISDGCR